MVRKGLFGYLIIICIIANLFSVFAFAVELKPVYNPNTVESIMASTSVSELKAKAAVLIDASTGQVLSESNSNDRLPIASVTKIMSMLDRKSVV